MWGSTCEEWGEKKVQEQLGLTAATTADRLG